MSIFMIPSVLIFVYISAIKDITASKNHKYYKSLDFLTFSASMGPWSLGFLLPALLQRDPRGGRGAPAQGKREWANAHDRTPRKGATLSYSLLSKSRE
jgi:hypothetical protein